MQTPSKTNLLNLLFRLVLGRGLSALVAGVSTSGVVSSLPPLSFPWVAGAIPSFCSWDLGSAHPHDAGRRLPCLGVVASGPASVTIAASLSFPSLGFLPPCLGVKRNCFFCDDDPIAWLGDFWGSVVGLVAAATLLLLNSRWDWILVGGPFLPKVRSTAVGAIVMVFTCNCLTFRSLLPSSDDPRGGLAEAMSSLRGLARPSLANLSEWLGLMCLARGDG
jgi:hypothetical protein